MPSNRRPLRRQRRAPSTIPLGLWCWLTDQHYDPIGDAKPSGLLITFQRPHLELWLAHRDRVVAWYALNRPGRRPQLWWEHEAVHPRRRGESELEYLRRHALLLPGEDA